MKLPANILQSLGLVLGLTVASLQAVVAQPLTNRIDNVPMYGQPELARPDHLRALDDKFVADAVAGLGSREKASDAWWREAERFFAEGNLDLAMRRYNQAWLLNPNGFRPYWGFARVLLESDRFDEASRQFERAKELLDDPFEKPALLTDTASVHTFMGRRALNPAAAEEHFRRARELLQQAIESDPKYGNAYKRYAFLLFYQKDYAGAWQQVKLAQSCPGTVVPAAFIRELQRVMPEPK